MVKKSSGDNRSVADMLDRIGDLMDMDEENRFRIRAYREAARQIRDLDSPVRDMYEERGAPGLREISGVGRGLARTIGEILETGRSSQLDDLQGRASPEKLFEKVPGVGPKLARRIASSLSTKSEGEAGRAFESSLYAGLAYIGTVILLISPYMIIPHHLVCLLVAILVLNFYISVAKGHSFKRRFGEMTALSLGVAALSFGIGYLVRITLGVEV